jgi:hypothetical protein
MQKLTHPQKIWLLRNYPFIDHYVDGLIYNKLVQSDLTKDIYLDPIDYADLPMDFHQLTEPEEPKRNHWYLALTILCVLLAATSPYWKDIAGDWFAYITLTAIAIWALIRYNK